MRIISGKFKGRVLKSPSGLKTRPTADRVRESIFNILPYPDESTTVLDLFAGTGALGLEALSRGAKHAVFVEQNKSTALVLQRNITALNVTAQSQVCMISAWLALKFLQQPFEWIFLDPPYHDDLLPKLLQYFGDSNCPQINAESILIVEHPTKMALPLLDSYGKLVCSDTRTYGQTAISFFTVAVDSR